MRVTFWRKRAASAYDNPYSLASKAKFLQKRGWLYSPELGKWYIFDSKSKVNWPITIPAETVGKLSPKELEREIERLKP